MARKPRENRGTFDHPINTGPRIGLYHRASTTGQDATLARAELLAWARRQGGHVVLNVEEHASGSWTGRPGLAKILSAAERGAVDTLAVWALDRLGRSTVDLLNNVRTLAESDVRLCVLSQGIDIRQGGDPMSHFMIAVLAAAAQFERDMLRSRTLLGLAKARAAGKRIGRPRHARPTADEVRAARERGLSWNEVGEELGCTPSLARKRLREAAGQEAA